ncbi:DM13 domain-containing protein [Dermabacteraceae bacterium TAE3-ERU27]|nr:DM13 domain-containing protein [Dermabacteraceae bacterium TAE3-ERU27]
MKNKKIALTAIAVVFVAVAGVVLALTQPWRAFTSSTVDEALPGTSAPSAQSAPAQEKSAQEKPAADKSAPEDGSAPAQAQEREKPAAPAGPVTLAQGEFTSLEHKTSGTAKIVELPDGSRVLRLENLASSDGPDLKVIVTGKSGGYESLKQADYTSLGALKATHGNQNYALPADFDIKNAASVLIWCERFSAPFGVASLK